MAALVHISVCMILHMNITLCLNVFCTRVNGECGVGYKFIASDFAMLSRVSQNPSDGHQARQHL